MLRLIKLLTNACKINVICSTDTFERGYMCGLNQRPAINGEGRVRDPLETWPHARYLCVRVPMYISIALGVLYYNIVGSQPLGLERTNYTT